MEEVKGYEYSDKRICKHNIQRETCRECLFEVLCNLEDKKDQQSSEPMQLLGKSE